MIKFFRHIRKELMEQNKTGKYLKYAIGEIFLVMIGILLALQVNNWNEHQKTKQVERKMLKELRADLTFSMIELDTVALYNKKMVVEYLVIRDYIENDLPYNNRLDSAFAQLDTWHMPYLPFTAYESLKEKGVDLISNDSLRRSIANIYEFHLKSLIEDMGKWEWSFNQNTTQRIMVKNIRRDSKFMYDIARPNDFEKLKKDNEFRNFLSILIPIRSDHYEQLTRTSTVIKRLLVELDKEIKLQE